MSDETKPHGQFFPDSLDAINHKLAAIAGQVAVLQTQFGKLLTALSDLANKHTASLEQAIHQVTTHTQEAHMADPITQVVNDVAAEDTVIKSAVVAFSGIQKRIDDAVAAALAGGATAAQLAPLTALSADIQANTKALADAVAQNTPSAPPAAPAKKK